MRFAVAEQAPPLGGAYIFIGKSVMGKAVYFDFRPYSCGFRRLAENLLLKIVYISGFYPAFSWRKYTRNR